MKNRQNIALHFCLLPFAFCLFSFLTVGCGRKGPVRPPEDVAPQTITDLSARSTAQGVELSWSRPAKYSDGKSMPDLGGFEITRAVGHAAVAFERLTALDVSDRDRFRPLKRFRYLDRATTVGTLYRYRVVSFTVDGYGSAPSNVATVERTLTTEEKHASFPPAQR